MRRLQGKAFHARKKHLKAVAYNVTRAGNICVYYEGDYYHYLNNDEKAAFKPDGLEERSWVT